MDSDIESYKRVLHSFFDSKLSLKRVNLGLFEKYHNMISNCLDHLNEMVEKDETRIKDKIQKQFVRFICH